DALPIFNVVGGVPDGDYLLQGNVQQPAEPAQAKPFGCILGKHLEVDGVRAHEVHRHGAAQAPLQFLRKLAEGGVFADDEQFGDGTGAAGMEELEQVPDLVGVNLVLVQVRLHRRGNGVHVKLPFGVQVDVDGQLLEDGQRRLHGLGRQVGLPEALARFGVHDPRPVVQDHGHIQPERPDKMAYGQLDAARGEGKAAAPGLQVPDGRNVDLRQLVPPV